MDASSEAPDTAAIPWDTLHSSIWRAVLQQLPPRQRCQAAVVCSSWRRHALSLCSQHLTLSLHSSRSCGALGLWLRRHGHTLTSLDITDSYYTHERVQGASRIRPVDRLALLQGLHGGGRPLASLTSLRLRLNELSPADAAVLGLCACPCLTSLQLDSNGSSIGVAGAQGLAPLSQLQALLAPAQSLGDEGLRIICVSMPRLANINLHNDGHVTDDGLPYLARLRHLTSLDLQGSISITNRGMSSLAQCVPQLQELNISWCAGVDDYGLGQLYSLTALTALNLAATGISFTDATVLQALSQLSALARLRLDRLAVGEPQLEALAAALPGLQDLSLAYNSRLASFASLRALSGLSQLTRLDVSHPQKLQHPGACIPALFDLTQLCSLSASYVMPQLPQASFYGPFAAQLAAGQSWLADAADAGAAACSAAAESTAAAAANSVSRHKPTDDLWQRLARNLSGMQHLTELHFQGNFSSPWGSDHHCGVHHTPAPPLPQPAPAASTAAAAAAVALLAPPAADGPAGGHQVATLLHALANVQPQPPLRLLRLSLSHPKDMPLHDAQAVASVHAGLLELVAGHLARLVVAADGSSNNGSGKSSGCGSSKEPAATASADAAVTAAAAPLDVQSNASCSSSGQASIGTLLPAVLASDGKQHAWWREWLPLQPPGFSHREQLMPLAGGADSSSQVMEGFCLTPSEAAALVKQLLPSLQLLQLTTKPFEQDSSGLGLVKWPT